MKYYRFNPISRTKFDNQLEMTKILILLILCLSWLIYNNCNLLFGSQNVDNFLHKVRLFIDLHHDTIWYVSVNIVLGSASFVLTLAYLKIYNKNRNL